jgi:hypothetical protein
MQILNADQLPQVNGRGKSGKNGSKYFTDAIQDTCNKLLVGQGFLVDLLPDTSINSMLSGTRYRINEYFENDVKQFTVQPLKENTGILVKRITDKVVAKKPEILIADKPNEDGAE